MAHMSFLYQPSVRALHYAAIVCEQVARGALVAASVMRQRAMHDVPRGGALSKVLGGVFSAHMSFCISIFCASVSEQCARSHEEASISKQLEQSSLPASATSTTTCLARITRLQRPFDLTRWQHLQGNVKRKSTARVP